MDEESNKDKETKKNPLAEYLKVGGPGRPKGRINDFSALKKSFLKAWKDGGGNDRLKELIKTGTKAQFLECARIIASLLPKDSRLEIEGEAGPKVIINVFPKGYVKPIDVRNEINNPPVDSHGFFKHESEE